MSDADADTDSHTYGDSVTSLDKRLLIATLLSVVLMIAAVAFAREPVFPNDLVLNGNPLPNRNQCATYDGNRWKWRDTCGGDTAAPSCHKHQCSNELCYDPIPCPTGYYQTGNGKNGDAICQPFPTPTATASNTATPTPTPTVTDTPTPTLSPTATATPKPKFYISNPSVSVCSVGNFIGLQAGTGLQMTVGTDCATDPDTFVCMEADASNTGCVSATTQTFGGNKTFNNNVTIVENLTIQPTSCPELATDSTGLVTCRTATPTPTATITVTPTPTATVTPTPTATVTVTSTATLTPTPTLTATPTPTTTCHLEKDADGRFQVFCPVFIYETTPTPTVSPTSTVTATAATPTTVQATPTQTPVPTPTAPTLDVIGNSVRFSLNQGMYLRNRLFLGELGDGVLALTIPRRLYITDLNNDVTSAGANTPLYVNLRVNPGGPSATTPYGARIEALKAIGNAQTTGTMAGARFQAVDRGDGISTGLQGQHVLAILGPILGTPVGNGRLTSGMQANLTQAWARSAFTGVVSPFVASLIGDAELHGPGTVTTLAAGVFTPGIGNGGAGAGTITNAYGLYVSGVTIDGFDVLAGGTITNGTMSYVGNWNAGPTYTNRPIGLHLAQQTATGAVSLKNDGRTVETPDAAQNITAAGNTIAIDTTTHQLTANASYVLTSTPTLADGEDGQRVLILNVDSADIITLQDETALAGSNLRLGAAARALGPRDSIQLIYSSTLGDWIEVYFSNVL